MALSFSTADLIVGLLANKKYKGVFIFNLLHHAFNQALWEGVQRVHRTQDRA